MLDGAEGVEERDGSCTGCGDKLDNWVGAEVVTIVGAAVEIIFPTSTKKDLMRRFRKEFFL